MRLAIIVLSFAWFAFVVWAVVTFLRILSQAVGA